VQFEQFAPHPELARHVRVIWSLSHERPTAAAVPQLVPPDGCVELVFNFGDPVERAELGRPPERQPRQMFVGEISRSLRIRWTGRIDLVGVRFAPGRARPFLAVAMEDAMMSFLSNIRAAPAK
jgi:hypothetical protein